MYLGALIVPSLMLNRRARDQTNHSEKAESSENSDSSNKNHSDPNLPEVGLNNSNMEDKTEATDGTDVPYIYACATMWHETEDEMKQLLKSLFR